MRTIAQKRRVLIVDHDPGVVRQLYCALTSRGYDVEAASDAISALIDASRDQVDLLILEVEMPNVSGPQLASALAHLDGFNGAQVIFTSALTIDSSDLPLHRALLRRPPDVQELLSAISTVADDWSRSLSN